VASTSERLVAPVRSWAVWRSGRPLAAWVTLVVTVAAGLAVLGAATTTAGLDQIGVVAGLVGCGAVCVEAVRRVGEAAGVSKDLMSAWTLPAALLLPPVWSLLVPIPLTVLLQLRVRRGLVHRRVYSVAAIGLANAAVSVGFHRALAGRGLRLGRGLAIEALHAGPGAGAVLGGGGRAVVVALALACALGGCALNVALIGVAVRLDSPETSWRSLVLDRDQRRLDVGELCLGVSIAGCWLLTPVLGLTMLAPVLLVQQSLTHAQLRAAARLDSKTGLLNAQAWQAEAEREIVRANRERRPLAILIGDLDHFKQVNDTFGHLTGDVALRAAAGALGTGLRPSDLLGRFGGEEFTVVLPGTGAVEAHRIAERLRQAVAEATVLVGDVRVPLSVSLGVAVLGRHGDDLTDLLAAADAALYRAKDAGRNRVSVAR